MGIYTDGIIRGIAWRLYNECDELVISFEKSCKDKMTTDKIREAENEYNKLTKEQQNFLIVRVYVNCTSTYGKGSFMQWWPINKDALEKLFLHGDIPI